MSFKLFIYYCSLGGGWAAFVTWAIVQGLGIRSIESVTTRAMLIGAILGALIAATIGAFEAVLNSVGFQRVLRTLTCLGLGFLSGLIGSLIGQKLFDSTVSDDHPTGNMWMLVLGWIFVGTLIGASIGVYDMIQASMG